jgi:histidinol dehydrogenase
LDIFKQVFELKTIKGFAAAKSTLSRQTPELSLEVSAEVKAGLKKLFGTEDLEQAVRRIIDDVRERGDRALFDLTAKIDGIKLSSLEVSKEEIATAKQKVSPELVSALRLAADRIASFHRAQKENIWHELKEDDYGQLIRPLERVGFYVPGGTASYPSTVLMTAVPARIAGVRELVLVTPPAADGKVPPATLVAAGIAGVDRIFSVGGAQAIAALAYGTDSIPRVDKICGPGNIFVTTAKRLVYGTVAIDGLQGPSEILIIADESANPAYCAADMLAQAEHDSLASAILITISQSFADQVNLELERQLSALGRQAIAQKGKRWMITACSWS